MHFAFNVGAKKYIFIVNILPPDPRTRTFLGLTKGSVISTNFLLIPPMASLMHCRAERLSTLPWLRTICAISGILSNKISTISLKDKCSELVDYTRSYLQTDKFGLHFGLDYNLW